MRGESFAKAKEEGKEEGREAYTTAVILRAEAIRKVWAMIHNLTSPSGVNQRRRRRKVKERIWTNSIKAPFVPVSSPEAVATMYTSASLTLSWKVTLQSSRKSQFCESG